MNIITGTADTLSAATLFDMAHYRYRVFVEKLGWNLATRGRMELDQFDRRDTCYVLARTCDHRMTGVARLLPTDRPYLLGEIFPQLLGTCMPPHSTRVWELSRFAAMDPDGGAQQGLSFPPSRLALELLDAAMLRAAQAGACDLIAVSPLGVERILRRAGVVARRLAPPMRVQEHALYACRIDLKASLLARARLRRGLPSATLQ